MNNPFDYTPDAACDAAFGKLVERLRKLRESGNPDDINFCRELEAGKMLGVLIATDSCGISHILYAFSGQLGKGGFHYPGFVGPVFDYLQPDGYFKQHEAEISRQNREIALFENNSLAEIKREYESMKERLEAEVSEYKEKCRQSKLQRAVKRETSNPDEHELAAMLRQSQFEKAELHRLKKRATADLEPYAASLENARTHLEALKEKRRSDSEALQEWLFSNFRVMNARGECRNLNDIFAETAMKVPPSGAGECCAPKLLQAAYMQGLTPVLIAEYWYGKPKGGEVRMHGRHYPACRGKCLPVLRWMLQGLDVEPSLDREWHTIEVQEPKIIFENQWFCIIDKPSGMLSVPGKSAATSLQRWLEDRFGPDNHVKMAHRLDQDTSGLIIATFGESAYKTMQSLFATRQVAKTYIAVLDGDYKTKGMPASGRIELPLSPDWLDRPRQRIDFDGGKPAVTDFEFTSVSECRSRVLFHPLTGRTHQLRVHSASEMGLGMPIVGDRLYGKSGGDGPERLLLHAHKMEFTFPIDGRHYCFESPVPF